VRDLLKPYNRRLMFWGDIALNHPDLIGNIPKDMIVMNWQYRARDDLDASIKAFQGRRPRAIRVSRRANLEPDLSESRLSGTKNITNFVRDGQKAGRHRNDEYDLGRRRRIVV
jgi:hypothetical protein